MARYLVGIDVGGTFTDFVCYDPQTRATIARSGRT
jgi:N-methylhydantoinase A/oxoprolinase/acetone carboxylase beta subunit